MIWTYGIAFRQQFIPETPSLVRKAVQHRLFTTVRHTVNNDKARLICQHNVPAQGEIVLEPAARKIVVKDLVGR